MEGIHELFIDYLDTIAGGAIFKCVPARHAAFLIHVAQLFQNVIDGISTAIGSDDSTLGGRILNLLALLVFCWFFRQLVRQRRYILPVGISGEVLIRIEFFAFKLPGYVLAIAGMHRPVHELVRCEGTGVKLLDSKLPRKKTGDGMELIWCHIPCKRDDDSASWCVWCMGARGVEK